jgi:Rho GTPase-activating protein 1
MLLPISDQAVCDRSPEFLRPIICILQEWRPKASSGDLQIQRYCGKSRKPTTGVSRTRYSLRARHQCAFLDTGQTISLASFHDPNIAAVLLKSFFRDLPDPVFPESLYYLIQRCPPPTHDPADRSCVDYIRDTILPAVERISPATIIVLSYVLRELKDLQSIVHTY